MVTPLKNSGDAVLVVYDECKVAVQGLEVLYCNREEWTAACLFIERITED